MAIIYSRHLIVENCWSRLVQLGFIYLKKVGHLWMCSYDGLKRDKPGPKFPIRRCANNGFGPIP
jgi:hypothetical protein